MAKQKQSANGLHRTYDITETMEVELTGEAYHSACEQLARALTEKDELEAQLKAVNKTMKANIEAKTAEIVAVSAKVQRRREIRDVPCEVLYDEPKPGEKTIRRKDTLEVLRTEVMTQAENQKELPLQ